MTLSRRKMLALVGGGTIFAATAGSAAFLTTRTPHRALAPWAAAGTYGEIRRDALSWALLAPNPHNRQPWRVALDGDDGVILWRDPELDLPHTDPFGRQLTIGMGCFVELMVLAAAQAGYGVDLTLFPEGDAGPVAIARFKAGAGSPDPLFAAAPDRRSCKEAFEDRPVPAAEVAKLAAFGDIHTDPDLVETLKRLTVEAFDVEMETPRTWKESIDLLRIGKAEINASPDGIDLGGPFFDVAKPLGLMNREDLLDPSSFGNQQNRTGYLETLRATRAYVSLRSPGNTRAEQLEAGRRWLRLNLATTQAGLALHPVSQALQEYPEMADLYAEAHRLLGEPGDTVQMLGRLGYGPTVAQTPRWPLDTKLSDA